MERIVTRTKKDGLRLTIKIKANKIIMNWNKLETVEQLEQIQKQSEERQVLIFKHSTRCSTSRMVLDRLERNWKTDEMANIEPYFLDLISYREISNQISGRFGVDHESPQVLIIKNGKAIYDSSHLDIDYKTIQKMII